MEDIAGELKIITKMDVKPVEEGIVCHLVMRTLISESSFYTSDLIVEAVEEWVIKIGVT